LLSNEINFVRLGSPLNPVRWEYDPIKFFEGTLLTGLEDPENLEFLREFLITPIFYQT